MRGVFRIALLLATGAATPSGFYLTATEIPLIVAFVTVAGGVCGVVIQNRRHQPPEYDTAGLADYAAHRLEYLEAQHSLDLVKIAALEAQLAERRDAQPDPT